MLTDELATRQWWRPVLRGVLAIAFGILTILVPGAAIQAFVLLFAIYALADGVSSLALTTRKDVHARGLYAVLGVLSIAAGVIALIWPGITALALFSLIAIWAIILGATELVLAFSYGPELESNWALVLGGMLWVAFGVILLVWPGPGLLTLLALVGSFAIVRGVMLVVAGVHMRRVHARLTTAPRS